MFFVGGDSIPEATCVHTCEFTLWKNHSFASFATGVLVSHQLYGTIQDSIQVGSFFFFLPTIKLCHGYYKFKEVVNLCCPKCRQNVFLIIIRMFSYINFKYIFRIIIVVLCSLMDLAFPYYGVIPSCKSHNKDTAIWRHWCKGNNCTH